MKRILLTPRWTILSRARTKYLYTLHMGQRLSTSSNRLKFNSSPKTVFVALVPEFSGKKMKERLQKWGEKCWSYIRAESVIIVISQVARYEFNRYNILNNFRETWVEFWVSSIYRRRVGSGIIVPQLHFRNPSWISVFWIFRAHFACTEGKRIQKR